MSGRGAVHLAVDQPSALGGVIQRTACGRVCGSSLTHNRSFLFKDVTCKRCLVMMNDEAKHPSSFKETILKHYEESYK